MGKLGKKVLVVFTLVGALVGIATTVPQIREIVDDFLPGNQETIEENELQKMESPTNIVFDESQRTITFDEILGASGYKLRVYSNIASGYFEYTSPIAHFEIALVDGLSSGDTLNFEVIALGDNVTTSNSEATQYSYTMQHLDDEYNIQSTNYLYNRISRALKSYFQVGVITVDTINSIQLNGTTATVKGIAKNGSNREFIFSYDIDLSNKQEHLPASINTASQFNTLIKLINAQDINYFTLDRTFTDTITNVQQGLATSGAFAEYISQGYQITVLQQKNSSIYNVDSENKAFDVTGVYVATKEGSENITFEVKHTVNLSYNQEFNSDSEYFEFFNQNGSTNVEVKENKVYESNILKLLETINQIKESYQTDSAEQSM